MNDIGESAVEGKIDVHVDVNDLIDECIEALVDDSIRHGVDALVRLADVWAKAGMTYQSFEDIRKYIVQEAISRTDERFIFEKLKIAERDHREIRNAKR